MSRPAVLCSMVLALCACSAAWAQGGLRERLQQKREQKTEQAGPAGDYRYTIEQGGLSRSYLVHVPRGYDPARATPLLVALHGGGGNMQFQADDANYGLISKSDSAGFIAVFPNGYSPFPGGKLATWNAGNCCGQSRNKQVDDVGFIRAVLSQVQGRLNVDPGRIYATGMSNGGMLAQRLACEMAETFKAIAAVAGTDNTRSCTPARPISVLAIHAQDDDHVLFDGGAGPGAFRDESKVTPFTAVPETMSRWVRRDRCSAAPPTRVLDRPGAYCERYSGCADGVQLQLCVTETGGHSWPGAGKVRGGKAPASQALSANDVMWDFFSSL